MTRRAVAAITPVIVIIRRTRRLARASTLRRNQRRKLRVRSRMRSRETGPTEDEDEDVVPGASEWKSERGTSGRNCRTRERAKSVGL